jgi:hypothetical protein
MPDLTSMNTYLLLRILQYHGIRVEVPEGVMHMGEDWSHIYFIQLTHAPGKYQPNREQRTVSEYTGCRLIISTSSLLKITDDRVRGVRSR